MNVWPSVLLLIRLIYLQISFDYIYFFLFHSDHTTDATPDTRLILKHLNKIFHHNFRFYINPLQDRWEPMDLTPYWPLLTSSM